MFLNATVLFLLLIDLIHGIYQSYTSFSALGKEFSPRFASLQLLSSSTQSTRTRCTTSCNQLSSCRIFDYDSVSQRCRLFEADMNTGSIIASASPTSIVGTVRISSSFYSSLHNQACSMCQQNRYEVCSSTTNTCGCPSRTYWTGSVCALQLFQNDSCSQSNACRLDLNFTCSSNCYGEFIRCIRSFTNYTVPSSAQGYGLTFAGGCNGSTSTNQTVLYAPADILLLPNRTMMVGNNDGRLFAFAPNNRSAQTIATYPSWPTFMYFDNRTENLYITFMDMHYVHIFPSNRTIPPDGLKINTCLRNRLSAPTVITSDSIGNVYIACAGCNWVMRWAPNATNGTIVAGSSTGNSGSTASTLYFPYGLALDEANSYLYVADRFNNRIQRFTLGGSPNAVTVAGTGSAGVAANQLNGPTEIYLSRIDRSLYIVDSYNNRIQKWSVNATSGVNVAGSPSGNSGSTPQLLNTPYAIALDEAETILYVSDSSNNRIQRFTLL